MKTMQPALVSLLVLAFHPAAQSAVEKQGRYWVETVEGALPAGTRLRISSVGAVTVQGEAVEEVRYSVTKKVRARNRQEAERLLQKAEVTADLQNITAVISLEEACRRCGFTAEMNVVAPMSTHRALVSTRGGSLRVANLKGRVNAESEGGSLTIEGIGGALRASTAGGSISLTSIGGNVRCETAGGGISLRQARGDAILTTSGGDIFVQGVGGTLRAETAGGSIQAQDVGGSLIAATSGGSIHVERASGPVRAETAGGSIHVTSAPRGLHVETAGGDIRLKNVAGEVVAANVAGNIQAYFLAGHPVGNSFLETNVGNIEVWLPVDLKVTVMALVELAGSLRRIQSDFGSIEVKREGDGFGTGSVMAEGALNGGGPILRIQNTTGRIKIRRLP